MEDLPLVSIITPVLNRAETIPSTLASVSAQGYPRIEHIVVDGGSTDGTLEKIQSFESRHDLRWVSGPDEGMYDAINKGMALARGDVLAYVNSDDFYLPWTVAAAVESLSSGADFVFGDMGILQVGDGETHFFVQFYPSFDLTYYTHVASIGQPTVFWTRETAARIGDFDASYRLIGDCEYWVRAATKGARFEHLDEILAIQIDHGDTLRFTYPERLNEEFRRMRLAYTPVAPPPRSLAWSKRRKSLRWRRMQLRFTIETLRPTPRRWRNFSTFLRENNLRLTKPTRAVASLLPASIRPGWAMRIDTGDVETRLLEAIGASSEAG